MQAEGPPPLFYKYAENDFVENLRTAVVHVVDKGCHDLGLRPHLFADLRYRPMSISAAKIAEYQAFAEQLADAAVLSGIAGCEG